jgi:hypothetical protein
LAVGLLALACSFAVALLGNGRRLIAAFLERESDGLRWVVFAKDGADLSRLESDLRQLPGLRTLTLVSKDEALERARRDPTLAGGVALTGRNPFPASFEIRWDPSFLRADALDWAARRTALWDGVDEVGYDRTRVDRLTLLQRLSSQWDLALAVLLSGAALAVAALVGRWLFFTTDPIPWRPLAWGALSGVTGGVAGAAAAFALTPPFPTVGLLAGAGVGLLAVCWTAAIGHR